MTDHSIIDYHPPSPTLEMTPAQAALFNEPTRTDIMMMLAERPATTAQLAEAMEKPRGTVGHHLKALEEAGLIAVVATRKVRALTEKYYGRTARTFVFPKIDEGGEGDHNFLAEAMRELRTPASDEASIITIRHARIPHERAAEFADEILKLAEGFASQPRGGETVYGFLAGVYPTDRPALGEDK